MIKRIFTRILDFFWPMCPSGIGHRVRLCVVTNINGNQFCWHSDCFTANNADVKQHIHNYSHSFKYAGKVYEKCRCGASRTIEPEVKKYSEIMNNGRG